jgi:glycosyltransferase involved in cell wall biosynthesis
MSRSSSILVEPKTHQGESKVRRREPPPRLSMPEAQRRLSIKARPGVLYQGFIFDGSGYSEETWVEALGLDAAGIYLQLHTMRMAHDLNKLLPREARRRLEELKRQRVDLSRGVFYVCAPPDLYDPHLSGIYRIGRTMFETDRIPDGWLELCQSMDEIWVPCQFNMETFAGAGVDLKRLRVVHPGVDTRLFRPGAAPLAIPMSRAFNFLSVFDWHERKGYDVLLRAFLTEFRADEDVALILKVYQINDPVSDLEAKVTHFIERRLGMRLEDTPPVVLLNGYLPLAHMPQLYAAAQAFVLPSRGEGYGRPYMEAMSCGLPVIATRWSGQMEFLNDQNGYLIELEGLVEAPPNVDMEYYAEHRWAEPSVDDLRHKMRRVMTHREEAQQRARQARETMARSFDWDVVIPQWVNEFRRLLD